jgi:hypothetical protein
MKALQGVLFVLLVIGSLVYAVYAQVPEPPLEPAYTFMRWQALWSGGTYGVKLTFAVTWFVLLGATLGPLFAVTAVVDAARRVRPALPGWPACGWERMQEPARLRLGIGLTGLALLFGGLCWFDAEALAPVSFLAQILLVLWPFMLVIGPLLVLDVGLPAGVVVGSVAALERTPGSTPEQAGRFHLQVGERRFELAEELWRQLAVGDEVALRSSAMFERVLELRRRA